LLKCDRTKVIGRKRRSTLDARKPIDHQSGIPCQTCGGREPKDSFLCRNGADHADEQRSRGLKAVLGDDDVAQDRAFEPLALGSHRKAFAMRLSKNPNIPQVDDA
jgi:hypothetical protein